MQDNNLSEKSTNQAETDAARDVSNTTRTECNRVNQSTQYLTRFGNVPTSSGQGGERVFIDSTINYNLFLLQGISKRDSQWDFQGYFSGIFLEYNT